MRGARRSELLPRDDRLLTKRHYSAFLPPRHIDLVSLLGLACLSGLVDVFCLCSPPSFFGLQSSSFQPPLCLFQLSGTCQAQAVTVRNLRQNQRAFHNTHCRYIPTPHTYLIRTASHYRANDSGQSHFHIMTMSKEMPPPSQSVTEINACVSTSNGNRSSKETTFREWLLENQIGASMAL